MTKHYQKRPLHFVKTNLMYCKTFIGIYSYKLYKYVFILQARVLFNCRSSAIHFHEKNIKNTSVKHIYSLKKRMLTSFFNQT